MATSVRSDSPGFSTHGSGGVLRLSLHGLWTVSCAHEAEATALAVKKATDDAKNVVLDISGIQRMDTAGAWLIDRACQRLVVKGISAKIEGARPEQAQLLEKAQFRSFERGPAPGNRIITFLADIGEGLIGAMRDFFGGMEFLGRVMAALVNVALHPRKFRGTSVIFHLESFAFRSVPIVALINFLVGCIVAQQGIFQLQRFGASAFAVDLIGILVLRELAVLLTSIMIAGRTGSAITAEVGSMKMREEIDALHVMGLDPIEVLIVPRLLALIMALPLLTFIADMAAIFGGLLTAWTYGNLSPEVFLSRLQAAISINTFLVGLIKAPFMALVIGLIAAIEGLAVSGSAESLGRQVTSSVVKSIFMVILVDGLFAVFFAAVKY